MAESIFKATYEMPKGLTKRKQNDLINEAERLLKLAIPDYKTLGKVKYSNRFEIYYDGIKPS